MKKIIMLFLMPIIVLSILCAPVVLEAETINDLSFAHGKNLVDPNNMEYESGGVSSINNIFLASSGTLTIQAEVAQIDRLAAFFIFYDIDFVELSSVTFLDPEIETVNGGEVGYFIVPIPNNAFSFHFFAQQCEPAFKDAGCPSLMISYAEEPSAFEAFVAGEGLFDLRGEQVPHLRISYFNSLTDTEIKSLVKAYDAYDGPINNLLQIDSSEYSANKNVVGSYPVTLSVTDSNNNTSTGTIYIDVYDSVSPVITGPSLVEFPINTSITEEMILAFFAASDAYDGDIKSNLHVESEFSTSSNTVKTETITLYVEDSSQNDASKEVTLSFFDNIAPIITGTTTISLSYQVNQSINQIINSNIAYSDNIDLNPIMVIESDSYTGNEKRVGSYQAIIRVTDSRGNTASSTLNISVSDKIKPVIFLDNSLVETLSSVELLAEDFVDLLVETSVLDSRKNYEITVLEDTYTPHKETEGTYIYKLRFKSESGETLDKEFLIKVSKDNYAIDYNAQKVKSISTKEIVLYSIIAFLGLLCLLIFTLYLIKFSKKKPRKNKF